jgi:hypothetical protein
MGTVDRAHARLHTLAVRFAVLAFAAIVSVAIATGNASAAKTVVLGKGPAAAPACPENPCQAVGKATGFQKQIGKLRNPFRARTNGRIVAWSIKLSQPNAEQTKFFNDFYGGEPQARLAILKPVKDAKGRFVLRSQSPIEPLKDVLGSTTTFSLNQPLRVKEGQIIALTIPTWAPAFSVGLADTNVWRASRKKNKCKAPADIQAGSAHLLIGTPRAYGCKYSTARILYSATMVQKTAPKKPSSNTP